MPATARHDTLRPRKRPLQRRAQETVRAILQAAARVFSAEGYAGATTNHIAERAGVSIGSLYDYFPSKDALLVALMEQHLQEGEAILSQAIAGTIDDGRDVPRTVRRLIDAMVALHSHDRALHRVLFEEAPLPKRVRRRLASLEAAVTAHVATWLRTHPGATARDPGLAAAVVVQAVEGLTHKLVLYGERDEDLAAYVEEMVALVTAYLAAPPAGRA